METELFGLPALWRGFLLPSIRGACFFLIGTCMFYCQEHLRFSEHSAWFLSGALLNTGKVSAKVMLTVSCSILLYLWLNPDKGFHIEVRVFMGNLGMQKSEKLSLEAKAAGAGELGQETLSRSVLRSLPGSCCNS